MSHITPAWLEAIGFDDGDIEEWESLGVSLTAVLRRVTLPSAHDINVLVQQIAAEQPKPTMTEAQFKERYKDWEGDAFFFGKHDVIIEGWEDVSETPTEAMTRFNREVLDYAGRWNEAKAKVDELNRQLISAQGISAQQVIEAYEAYDGDDVAFFFIAWNRYLRGELDPCPSTKDGIHWVSDGSCNECGRKNFE